MDIIFFIYKTIRNYKTSQNKVEILTNQTQTWVRKCTTYFVECGVWNKKRAS